MANKPLSMHKIRQLLLPRYQTAPSRRYQLEALFPHPHLLSELRKVGDTRQILWQEYIRDYPGGSSVFPVL